MIIGNNDDESCWGKNMMFVIIVMTLMITNDDGMENDYANKNDDIISLLFIIFSLLYSAIEI